MEKNDYKKVITLKKSHFHTSRFTELCLKCQGKRDGKNEIPKVNSNWGIVTPTVRKEHDKVYSYMADLVGKVNEYNDPYYKAIQASISEFIGKSEDVITLFNFLKEKPFDHCLYIPNTNFSPDFENLLSSKRESEKYLDDIGIRHRRFEEYQQKLEKYKSRYYLARKEADELYKSIMINYNIVKKNINLVKPMFWKASAEIGIRLSWYWQGVLLKHKNAKDLPQYSPEPDDTMYEQYYNDMIKDVEEQIDKVITKYNEIITLKQL